MSKNNRNNKKNKNNVINIKNNIKDNSRFSELQNRSEEKLFSEIKNPVIKENKKEFNILNILSKLFKQLIALIITVLITILFLVSIANISISAFSTATENLNMFSTNAILIGTSSMVTSMAWLLIDKIKIYNKVYNFIVYGQQIIIKKGN